MFLIVSSVPAEMMMGSSGGYGGGGGSSSKGYEESIGDSSGFGGGASNAGYGQSHPAAMMMMSYGGSSGGYGGSGGSQGGGYSRMQAAPMMMNFADPTGYGRMMQPSGGYGAATHEYALEMLPQVATDMGEQYADSSHQPATMTDDRMQTSDGQQQANDDHDSTTSNHILGGPGGLNLASAALAPGMNTLETHFQLPSDRRRRRRR